MKAFNVTLVCCGFALLGTANAQVTLPHQFQAGQPARASEVNANFEAIRQAINNGFGLIFTRKFSASSPTSSGVATASCDVETIPISSSCFCGNGGGSRNFGVIFGCEVTSTGGIVGCFPEAGTFNPLLPSPQGNITVTCVGAKKVDGTIMPSTIFALSNARTSGAQQAPKLVVQEGTGVKSHAEIEAEMRSQELEFLTRMRSGR